MTGMPKFSILRSPGFGTNFSDFQVVLHMKIFLSVHFLLVHFLAILHFMLNSLELVYLLKLVALGSVCNTAGCFHADPNHHHHNFI